MTDILIENAALYSCAAKNLLQRTSVATLSSLQAFFVKQVL